MPDGFDNLLQWLTEFRETFTSIYQFTVKGCYKGHKWIVWQRGTWGKVWKGPGYRLLSLPRGWDVPSSQQMKVFTNTDTLSTHCWVSTCIQYLDMIKSLALVKTSAPASFLSPEAEGWVKFQSSNCTFVFLVTSPILNLSTPGASHLISIQKTLLSSKRFLGS